MCADELAAEDADDAGMREGGGDPLRGVGGGFGFGLDGAVLGVEGGAETEGRGPIDDEDGFAGRLHLVVPTVGLKLLPLWGR